MVLGKTGERVGRSHWESGNQAETWRRWEATVWTSGVGGGCSRQRGWPGLRPYAGAYLPVQGRARKPVPRRGESQGESRRRPVPELLDHRPSRLLTAPLGLHGTKLCAGSLFSFFLFFLHQEAYPQLIPSELDSPHALWPSSSAPSLSLPFQSYLLPWFLQYANYQNFLQVYTCFPCAVSNLVFYPHFTLHV